MKKFKSEYLDHHGEDIEAFCNLTGQRHLIYELYQECLVKRNISMTTIHNLLGGESAWSRASLYNKMNEGTNISLNDFSPQTQSRVKRVTSVINLVKTMPEGVGPIKGRKGANYIISYAKELKKLNEAEKEITQ